MMMPNKLKAVIKNKIKTQFHTNHGCGTLTFIGPLLCNFNVVLSK